MPVTLALAGDTMLGRHVADRLNAATSTGDVVLFAPEVRDAYSRADLRLLNLECCISTRGHPWNAPGKPFFFRAPPRATDVLNDLAVNCVTLANNHALDYGHDALTDTLEHLAAAGIPATGAGHDLHQARTPVLLDAHGLRIAIMGVTDHPADFAATPGRPGVAYADLRSQVPRWLTDQVRALHDQADIVIVTPHWGPNMITRPLPHVRRAAAALLEAGATLVAGHSAHVFHGIDGPVLYDLGDFIDDYAVDPLLRNDLGVMLLVTLDRTGPQRMTAVPLALDCCHTRLADDAERAWIRDRLTTACAEFGTRVAEEHGSLEVIPAAPPERPGSPGEARPA